MISQTVEYALRAMVVLANQPDTSQTGQSIAAQAQLPTDYLQKILQALNRAGLVAAQRGKHGGFTLTRPPDELTILDIVNAVDPIRRIEYCPLKIKAHGTRLCALHRKLDSALALVEDAFSSTTLSDILEAPGPSRPLCETMVQVHAKAN